MVGLQEVTCEAVLVAELRGRHIFFFGCEEWKGRNDIYIYTHIFLKDS